LIETQSLVGQKGDKGDDGLTPTIGENGNWWIGDNDTGVSAIGLEVSNAFNEIINHLFIDIYDDESLSKILTIDTSNIELGYDYNISVRLIHEFTEMNSIYNSVFFDSQITDLFTIFDIEVPFHGLFKLEFAINLTMYEQEYGKVIMKSITFDEPEYNIAWLNGTMPALLAASDFFSYNSDIATYIELIRPKTFKFDMLPENMYKMPIAVSPTGGNYNQNPFTSDFFLNNVSLSGDNLTTKWLEELYFINPTSRFNIMIGDNRTQFVNSLLNSRIPLDNLYFTFYTDGSGTTNTINSVYSDQDSFNTRYDSLVKDVLTLNTPLSTNNVLASSKHPNFEYEVNSIEGWTISEELRNNKLS
jgi:hypothetical protein